ncbi:related to tetratricopeptide repeat domain protein-Neosartorya fischeri [Serendipita indica DSM 11827]|uniref:Related to tetratricopeptide repeat domain protein-Neosartorya fischeri n=1 Tax=Serendipita indica (strain DSM 11827) TaxID=1109443 RepID=G4T5U5_SERID|nr:related to tetratricopeptide repeat domain protein-Neosartorya fischeri [Serendipita indica DSM 11827]
MSGIRSRLQNIFHHSNQSEPAAGSNSSPLSISKALSKTDSSGFLEIAAGTDPIVDIVAIHGLQGHRESTWTTEKGVCWLRDFLPFDLPNARVLTYGYDADTRSRECVSTQTMRRHAETFAQALLRNRKEAPRRPIIFIAYDLGGIILKWALVICHNQRLDSKCDLRDILISTHAILFFGTPHFGIEDAALLQAINRLASLYMKTTSDVLKDLKSQSFELENVQSLYVAASEKINCIFFCEEYAMSGIPNPEALNVQYPHATIPGDRNARTITLSSNHGELVKFPVKSNVNYEAVVYYLKDNVTTASAGVKEKWVIEDGCRSAAKGELISHAIMLPKRRPPVSKYYVERVEIEALMTEKLLPGGPVQHQPRCILHGPQGAGKTQLAAKWTRDHEKSFTRVIVVDASSQVQLEADLERSIRSLGPEFSKMTWEDAVAYLDDNEKGWLLFIDNADSPDLKLDPYLPNSVHGTMIIATRNRGYIVHAPNGLVSVGGLEEGEAVKLLHAIANIAPKSDAQSLEIVRELGMLVLAITQAGACIRITQRLDTYLDAFHKQRAHITGVESAVDTDCAFSTRTAFDLSFQHLPTKTQEFMKLCAFLNPSHIPFALFEQSSSSHFTAKTVLESYPPQQSDRIFISDLEEILGRTWDEIAFLLERRK